MTEPQENKSLLHTYLGLIGLLALTVACSFFPLGRAGAAVALAIACAKAGLIAAIFMKLRSAPPMLRVFALAGLFWVAFLVAFVWSDYLSRGGIGIPGK